MEDQDSPKRSIKSIKEFKDSASLKKIKRLHAKDLNIKGIEKFSEQLELIEQITATESLFKNSPVIKKVKDS